MTEGWDGGKLRLMPSVIIAIVASAGGKGGGGVDVCVSLMSCAPSRARRKWYCERAHRRGEARCALSSA